MPIFYKNNYLRTGAAARYILPGDDEFAHDIGLEKHPTHTAYPLIDAAVQNLILTLSRKGWDVPGIDVTFQASENPVDSPVHCPVKIVGGLPGQKWQVNLNRTAWRADGARVAFDTSRLVVPGHSLTLEGDAFPGGYRRYIGDDWSRDEKKFLSNACMNARERVLPRDHLYYAAQGDSYCAEPYNTREYAPEGDERTSFKQDFIFSLFANYLGGETARLKKSLPDHENGFAVWAAHAKPARLPVPEFVPPLIVSLEEKNTAWDGSDILPLGQEAFCKADYAGCRIPDMAYQSFHYGYPDAPYHAQMRRWGADPEDPETSSYRVNLKYANDIYVIDESPYFGKFNTFYENFSHRKKTELSTEILCDMFTKMAKTIVPLADYKGVYAHPIYLIRRPLWDDEAEEITQPKRHAEKEVFQSASLAAVARRSPDSDTPRP